MTSSTAGYEVSFSNKSNAMDAFTAKSVLSNFFSYRIAGNGIIVAKSKINYLLQNGKIGKMVQGRQPKL